MDKIIILTGRSEPNNRLIEYLKMIFPECKIEILSRRPESSGNVPIAPEPATADREGKKNGKHFNSR